MGSEASIHKSAGKPNDHADNVCDQVVHAGAAVKTGLDEFDHTSEGTRPQKYREQSKAASSGEGEG